jgi:succinyl-diaminopimelate desuccinylase
MKKPASGSAAGSDALLSWLRQREDEMAALLAELVAIPTENPPGKNYGLCAAVLEKHLNDSGLDCGRFEVTGLGSNGHDQPVSLLASYGQGERILYFHGHYDVVPAQSAGQFQPSREGHFLFGRGACDMKGGIVAMLYAILALQDCKAKLNGRICLTLVPDEETGGARGSAWLAEQGVLGRDGIAMLLAEPTSGVVWNANRGAISLWVEVFGKSAHVGLQHRGENAFERLHRVVARIMDLKHEVEQRNTRFRIGSEQARNSILMVGGQSGGGANFNVVPEKCWFTIDRRINPEEDLAEEKARVIAVLESCKREGIPLRWEILQEGQSAACREDDPASMALARSIMALTGEVARFEICPGLLETRFYALKGIPAYAFGPGLLSVAHGPDEYIDLRTMINCAGVYALTAMDLLRP